MGSNPILSEEEGEKKKIVSMEKFGIKFRVEKKIETNWKELERVEIQGKRRKRKKKRSWSTYS